MPQILVNLPETVDPHMVDQLTAAITRMGGQAVPMPDQEGPADMQAEPGGEPAAEAGAGAPAGMPPGADPRAMLAQAMAMDEHGQQAPVPPGMQQAPPMDMGGAIKRPSQLRRPVPGPRR